MNTSATSTLGPFFSPSVLSSSTLGNLVDVHSKGSPSCFAPMEQTMEDGQSESHKDTDTTMASPLSSQTGPDSAFSSNPSASSSSSVQPPTASSVAFPKPPLHARFSTNLIPPTPPMATTPGTTTNRPPSPKNNRLSRPTLTSRLSSRAGGKRHASIGSARELPFPTIPLASSTLIDVPHTSNATPTQSNNGTPAGNAADHATPGWNARLREMGLHLPGMGSPRTPKSPKSGSMSSGGATPRSPEEHRGASYFSFRRRGSSGNVASPGKLHRGGPTPPPPPPPPPPALALPKPVAPSPISEESTTPPSVSGSKSRRANLSLDLGSTLTSRGSTASLPLMGHTPVQHLVQGDHRARRGSLVMSAPTVPPPHVHTPPVHPPAYEYPFLPNHAPRKPEEIIVEEVAPGNGPMEAGSWVISVRLPGFHPDGITIGTRRGRVLVLVADNYNDDDDGAGHFERRISFSYDADMSNIRAEFNGDMLRVTVPRRWLFGPGIVPSSAVGNLARPSVEDPTAVPKTG